ncbi:uncharacterized protein [Notamacropus eugenii]|uniref:uncharacterized protein n=1 Tax=Notamacropus eugenii TaxID=9315 RepID=UPI003B67D8A4
MALSKLQSKKEQVMSTIQEGERVLICHGPILREAECVRVVVQAKKVKYLVRYRSQGAMGIGMSGASRGAGASPDTLPGPSPSSSSSPGPGSSLDGASCSVSSSGPSTSSAAIPSTCSALTRPGGGGGGGGAGPSAGSAASGQLGSPAFCDYEWIPAACVIPYCSGKGSGGGDKSTDNSSTTSSEGGSHGDGEGAAAIDGEAASEMIPLHKRQGPGAPAKKYVKKQEVQVMIPQALKPLLVKDWELVTLGKKLFKLPAKKSVDAILAEYAISQQNCAVLSKRYAIPDLMAGIKEYFNVMLGSQLLYKFERPQYAEILASHPKVRMSQIYGGAHLLRLFKQIGSMMEFTAMDEHSLNLILGHMHDFLNYLACNPSQLFTAADYQLASAEYQQKAQ